MLTATAIFNDHSTEDFAQTAILRPSRGDLGYHHAFAGSVFLCSWGVIFPLSQGLVQIENLCLKPPRSLLASSSPAGAKRPNHC